MTDEKKIPLMVLGDFAWDVLVRTNSKLSPGGDVFGEICFSPGGSAANTAVWASRCGLHTSFIGKIGNDRFGLMAKENLQDENIDAYLISTDAHQTASIAIWVDQVGERSTVFGQGADFYLLASELPVQKIKNAGHLHLTAWSLFSDPPRSAAFRAAKLVKEAGGTVSLDPSSFQMIEKTGVENCIEFFQEIPIDLFFPNLAEGRVLTGEKTPEKIMNRLADFFPSSIIILKLGAKGVLIGANKKSIHIETAADSIIDSTGAGDSFAGAFLAKFLTGMPPVQAAAFAVKISSWVVNRIGSRPRGDNELESVIDSFDLF